MILLPLALTCGIVYGLYYLLISFRTESYTFDYIPQENYLPEKTKNTINTLDLSKIKQIKDINLSKICKLQANATKEKTKKIKGKLSIMCNS
jgi:hypothetical protein